MKSILLAGLLVLPQTTIGKNCLSSKLATGIKSRPIKLEWGCQGHPQPESCEQGRKLFFSKSLSPSNDVSCSSCHKAQLQFSDHRSSPELRQHRNIGPRTIELADIGWKQGPFFWNGRATSLQEAVFWPLYHPLEIGATDQQLAAYGGAKQVSSNLSHFLSSLKTSRAAWDDFLDGNCDSLSDEEKKGAESFLHAGCITCHHGQELAGSRRVEIDYYNLPQELFSTKEATYGSDWPLFGPYQKKVRLAGIPKSLRNIGKQGLFGRFGQHRQLDSFLNYHARQVGIDPIKDLSQLQRFLKVSLSSQLPDHPKTQFSNRSIDHQIQRQNPQP